jgi:hypothetical protein
MRCVKICKQKFNPEKTAQKVLDSNLTLAPKTNQNRKMNPDELVVQKFLTCIK